MTHQPAISLSISFQFPFNRAGGRTSTLAMRITAISTLVFSALSIFFLAQSPYGSELFEIIDFFPLTIFVILAIGYWPNKDLNQRRLWFILCAGVWAFTYFLSFFVSQRNERFTMALEGVVSSKYRGGHNAASIRVVDVSGNDMPVEGLAETEWNLIKISDLFVKKRGTFEARCAERTIYLERKSVIDAFRLEQRSQQVAAPNP